MKKAAVLGGTEDHIRLIELLISDGYYVYLLDYLDDPPAKTYADEFIQVSILDKKLVLSVLRPLGIRLVLATCIDQALLTMAYVAEELRLPCHISYDTAVKLTNKSHMKGRFIDLGIPTSRFLIASEKNVVLTSLVFPLVIKPVDSNSSKGITKILDLNSFDTAFSVAKNASLTKEVVIEEFVDGEELSVDVAILNYKPTIVMVTKNIKLTENKYNFTISQSYYPADISKTVLDIIRDIAEKLSIGYNIQNGPLLIQLLHKEDNVKVIEFSSRIGGGSKHHFIKMITGFDMLNWFLNVINGVLHEVKTEEKYKFGCVQYLYTENGKIQSYEGFDELLKKKVINQYFLYKPTGISIASHLTSADRPAGFIIADYNYQSFIERLIVAKHSIKVLDENGNNILLRVS
ncbi:ATP-grasp domain-containing protein [Bacteroidales bacterium]